LVASTTSLAAFAGSSPRLQADQDAVGHDDGVVDQHAQRDDQGTQGDALHGDAVEVHRDQGAGHRQQQDRCRRSGRCAVP
jgi:hypothetical protein